MQKPQGDNLKADMLTIGFFFFHTMRTDVRPHVKQPEIWLHIMMKHKTSIKIP